jgi:hypothetical protein
MNINQMPPRATLVLTRLRFEDWNTSKMYTYEWVVQRICFDRDPDGVDSHIGIRFRHRSDQMIEYAKRYDVSSYSARYATDVVWEIVQQNQSGFRTPREGWCCDFSTPTNFDYEFTLKDPTFVVFMHMACVDLIAGGIDYGPNLRYNAMCCPRYPYHCCEHHNAVNCVNSTMLVIASGIQRNNRLAVDYEWDIAQRAICSDFILAAYTPYNAVMALQDSNIIETDAIREPTDAVLGVACKRPLGSTPFPLLMFH